MFGFLKPKYESKNGFIKKDKVGEWLDEAELRLYPNGTAVVVKPNNFKYLAKPQGMGLYLIPDLAATFIVAE